MHAFVFLYGGGDLLSTRQLFQVRAFTLAVHDIGKITL